ncbi:transposase [Paraburkholderia mimosarum]|uniref:transposase n=2 Tax=Paraburkholderia mimosarum TaxID=312026 RepID=UPI000425C58C|nr:transposase [Paraburkholderia mimosarum]
MITVTRTLHAIPSSLRAIRASCKAMAFVRADLWRRYGALGTVGKSAADIRKEVTAGGWYSGLSVDGTIRAETTKDAVNDILTYKAAACAKVRQAIAKRTSDQNERKRLYTLLKSDKWREDGYLHRMMRKHFRHGVSSCDNQFIVRSDKHESRIVGGRLTVTIRIAKQYGEPLVLTTTSSGKNVDLTGCNLRVILKGESVEIHYATEKTAGRPCGTAEIGVDKGYSEAFTDSDGRHHGDNFGAVLTAHSDQVSKTGKARNKLHALEKKHRAAGRIAKAERIKVNNLGRVKLDRRRDRTQKRLRTIAYQAAHSIVDAAAVIGSEDLTAPIRGNLQWRKYNRRMSAWAKGVLAQALEEVCTQRGATHVVVNAAYTSQMDSFTGLLEGRRAGDKFYRANGDVLQADFNAARNVRNRIRDREIDRFMPHTQVKQILIARSSGATERQEASVGRRKPRQRSADKSSAQH